MTTQYTVEMAPAPQVLVVTEQDQEIIVNPPPAVEVRIASTDVIGPVGPPGPAGNGSLQEFVQDTPAHVWTVHHNLDKPVSVEVLVDGAEIIADILHVSSNTFTVTFGNPTAGIVLYS